MPNYRRDYTLGGCYFFTVVLQDRRADWLIRYIDAFRAAWRAVAVHYPFTTIAVTILPEHFHAVLTLPENDHDYSRRLGVLKSLFSRSIPPICRQTNASKQNKRESGIWQRRFWEHRIRDRHDLERHIHYTYYNPVKHGYVRQVADWPYTSFHRDVKNGLFLPDWGEAIASSSQNLYDD